MLLAAVLLFFPSGFLCALLFVFSLLFGLFWVHFLALGAGRRAALFSVGAVCVRFFVFFMKAILSFFIFVTFFGFFFFSKKKFVFIFALTFHECQFEKKTFLFIFIFWPFLKWCLLGLFFGFGFGLFGRFFGVRGGFA